MKIYLSKEDMLQDMVHKLSVIWIVRKHPPMPLRMAGHLEAFTIHKIYFSRAEAKNEADLRNQKSTYLFTVKRIDLGKLQ
jgi:hypothetical protein